MSLAHGYLPTTIPRTLSRREQSAQGDLPHSLEDRALSNQHLLEDLRYNVRHLQGHARRVKDIEGKLAARGVVVTHGTNEAPGRRRE